MIDNTTDKGYLTVRLKEKEGSYSLCELGFMKNPDEENFYVDYADGEIYISNGDEKSIIGSYETTPGSYGSRVFDYPSKRVIGLVGGELIHFYKESKDADAGMVLTSGECLAWYSESGSISLKNDPLSTFGMISGSELGGAAAFVALFYNYKFDSIFRDFFSLNSEVFRIKYSSILN